MTAIPEDLDYMAARVHGRRSQLAEGNRLEALSGLGSLEALERTILPEPEVAGALGIQRWLALSWLREMDELARGLSPRRARMMDAIAHRLAVEDEKAKARSLAAGDPELRSPLEREATLDRRSLEGLVAALERLDRADQGAIRDLVRQEVDHFHLTLAVRGRFLRGLAASDLLPWHVAGGRITREILSDMLAATDLARAAAMAVGAALDGPLPEPVEPAVLDRLAWQRFLRLARRTFRQGTTGLAVLVGYAAIRRVEVMNLTTLSEGIRLGLAAAAIRAHLVPPGRREVARA